MKNLLKIFLLASIVSSCSTGGMIYDDIFKKEQSPIVDSRRPVNGYGQPQQPNYDYTGPARMSGQPMMPQQQMGGMGNMGGNPLADIGNMGVGGPISQNPYGNPNLPPVQYQSPAAPVYNPQAPVDMSGYNPQMGTLSPWQGLPNPGYNQPQANYGYAEPQPSYPQQQPQMGYPQQPQMGYQQPMQPPAVSGLQAPTYTTSINMGAPTPAPMPMMYGQQPPYMPQQPMQPSYPPQQMQQQYAMPQQQPIAPQPQMGAPAPQPIYNTQPTPKEDDPLKPLSDNAGKRDPLEELQALEDEIERASKGGGEPPPAPEANTPNMNMNNDTTYTPDNYNDLSQIENPAAPQIPQPIPEMPPVPVQAVEMQDLPSPTPTPAEMPRAANDVSDILKSPSRNIYTPASGIIDSMQTQGIPASLASINQNINTLNTPLGFDTNGEPIVPASFKKQLRNAQVNQGLYPNSPPPPASYNIPPSNGIDSFQQRMNDMRL